MIDINYYEINGTQRIGEMILNNPESLNAFSPSDATMLLKTITAWRADDSVVAVILRGAGTKAFCAGGDVRSVHSCIMNNDIDAVDSYFADEYRADYAMHCFNKPLIAFAHGIVMGGGMGLMQGCHIRIITPQSRMAMPEHKIGFFPDVGAGFFLKKFNGTPQTGLYVGLSGRIFNSDETLALAAADMMMTADDYDSLLQSLTTAKWCGDGESDLQTAMNVCQQFSCAVAEQHEHPSFINKIYDDVIGGDMQSAIARLPDKEREAAQAGSSLSHKVWCEYYCRRQSFAPSTSEKQITPTAATVEHLRQTFALEYILAMNMVRHGDFAEGVRALLIDKDNNPQWKAAHDDASVAAIFESPLPEKSEAFLQSLIAIA